MSRIGAFLNRHLRLVERDPVANAYFDLADAWLDRQAAIARVNRAKAAELADFRQRLDAANFQHLTDADIDAEIAAVRDRRARVQRA